MIKRPALVHKSTRLQLKLFVARWERSQRHLLDTMVVHSSVSIDLLVDELEAAVLGSRCGCLRAVLSRRWINGIQDNLEHLVDHGRHQLARVLVRRANVRVRVDLNQPDAKILIHHEIVAEELVVILAVTGIQLILDSAKSVNNDVFHAWHEVAINLDTPSLQVWPARLEFV